MKKHILFFALLYMYIPFSHAQISTGEEPISFSLKVFSAKSTVAKSELNIMKSISKNEIVEEDLQDEKNGIPPRFGIKREVNYTLENSGTWNILNNGDKIWQLNIQSQGALSINLLYDKFWLPEGAKFFVYSEDKTQTIGAFTSNNNKGTKDDIQGFATELILSDNIVLEYYQPVWVKENGIISVSEVVHGYRLIGFMDNNEETGFRTSLYCHNNVRCTTGNDWQYEKAAIALIVVNGDRYCTGALLNTTANDNRPVFLTADHCLGGWGQGNRIKFSIVS